jgi:hypothetical protein
MSSILCDDNIKIDNRGVSFYGMGRLNCVRMDMIRRQAVMHNLMNMWVP